jgi:putative ABC transport system permease protein
MAGRKLRTGLTVFAIVLGVAMIGGAYVLTDTMTNAADKLESESYSQVDAAISSRTAFEVDEQEGFSEAKPLPADVLDTVRRVPEVQTASGEVTDFAKLVTEDGKVLASDAPPFAAGFNGNEPGAEDVSSFRLRQGDWPSGPDQIAIDLATSENEGVEVGDRIGLQGRGPARQFTVVGTLTFGSVESIGGATAAVLDLSTAQALFDKRGQVDSILVKAKPGVPAEQLRRRLDTALPPTAQVEDAAEQDRFGLEGLQEFIDIIQTILIAFAGVALFVGGFIIFNTLSITVAQRAREFALLRTIGASRGQILASVVIEAVVIGLVASLVGLAAGFGLAALLSAIFESVGLDLPSSGTVFKARTAIVALLVGVLVTLLAGLLPAVRATRTPPVEALREGAVEHAGGPSRRAAIIAAVVLALGLAGLGYGMFGSGLGVAETLTYIGLGCVLLFIGVAMISPRLVRPLASVLGRPAQRIGGAAGRLARQNSMRNPGRTATTAAGLMIGLALVAFVAVFGAGVRESFGSALDEQLQTDYLLVNEDGFSPFAPEAGRAAAGAPGVAAVSSIRQDQVEAFDDTFPIAGVDTRTIDRFLQYDWKQGSDAVLAQLGRDGAVVNEDFADKRNLRVGSRIDAVSPSGAKLDLVVRGVQSPPEFDPLFLGEFTISNEAFDRAFRTKRTTYTFIDVEGGASDDARKRLESAVGGFRDVRVKTQEDYRKDQEQDLNDVLGLLYVLLALSVIVSLFGIVNTLVLAVFERTRELGMLRAVGMTRRQVRRMVRHESIITALIGAALGLAIGVFLAFLVTKALEDEGLVFSFPAGTIVAFVIVAVIAGLLAAILPARRASRLNVLEALQYE